MKRKKLLERLAGWLDTDGQKQRDHREDLEELLRKLKKKEAGLEEKLQMEKGKHKHKKLSAELNVVRVQHAKGVKVLQELEES